MRVWHTFPHPTYAICRDDKRQRRQTTYQSDLRSYTEVRNINIPYLTAEANAAVLCSSSKLRRGAETKSTQSTVNAAPCSNASPLIRAIKTCRLISTGIQNENGST